MVHIKSQKGSVLVIILIAVALFAALSYTVSNMMRGGANIGKEKAGIYASEILTYAQSLKEAVSMLRISNGCEDIDISFENNAVSGYEHSPVASDNCKMFHSNGGGVSYISPSADSLDESFSADLKYGDWLFVGQSVQFDGVGTDGAITDTSTYDIAVVLPFIERAICLEINKKILNIDDIGEDLGAFDNSLNKYDGTFDSSGAALIDNAGAATVGLGLNAGCFCDSADLSCPDGEDFYFYQILIAR